MDSFLSEEVRKGLEQARSRALRKSDRLCVHMDGEVYRISRTFDDGFALPAGKHIELRGLVDVFDGPKHLYQCLIVCSELVDDEVYYEFKRTTEASNKAPVDFVRAEDAPVALLTR